MVSLALAQNTQHQLATLSIPKAERTSLVVARTVKHYLFYRNRDGEIRDIPFRAVYLACEHEECYLAMEVDSNRLGPGLRLGTFFDHDLLKEIHLATGHATWAVEKNGVTLVLDLTEHQRAALSKRINLNLADRPQGEYVIGFGQSRSGPLWRELSQLTHIIVAGSSDSGKSAYLRSLAWQLYNQPLPLDLYLVDLEGLTFAWASDWPILKAPVAQDVKAVTDITRRLLAEIERRAQLFEATKCFPENLAEYHAALGKELNERTRLPWVVTIFDEFTALAEAAGKRSELMENISQLAMRSRKYGVTLVLAGQDFKADLLNTRITNQLKTRIQFRCARREQSEVVLGQGGAERITVPGRALVRLDGKLVEIQTYWVDKQIILRAAGRRPGLDVALVLSAEERLVIPALMDTLNGEFNINRLWQALNGQVSNGKIRTMRSQWLARGWLEEQAAVNASSRVSQKFLDQVWAHFEPKG